MREPQLPAGAHFLFRLIHRATFCCAVRSRKCPIMATATAIGTMIMSIGRSPESDTLAFVCCINAPAKSLKFYMRWISSHHCRSHHALQHWPLLQYVQQRTRVFGVVVLPISKPFASTTITGIGYICSL
jgi:hypothetical protein